MADVRVTEEKPGAVKIVGIDIPIEQLFVLALKAALASIPALILLGFIVALLPAFLSGFMAGMR